VLAAVAMNDSDEKVRVNALGRIDDQLLLERIVLGDVSNEVRKKAYDRIRDKEIRERLPREKWDFEKVAELRRKEERLWKFEDSIAKGNLQDLEPILYSDSGATDDLRSHAWNRVDAILDQIDDNDRLMELYTQYIKDTLYLNEDYSQYKILSKIKHRLEQTFTTAYADQFIESELSTLSHNEWSSPLLLAIEKASEKTLVDLAAWTNVLAVWAAILPRVQDEALLARKVNGWYDISFFTQYNGTHPLSAALWTKLSAHKDFLYKLDADAAAKAIAESEDVDAIADSLASMGDASLAEKLLARLDKGTLDGLCVKAGAIIDDPNIDTDVRSAFIATLPTDSLRLITETGKGPWARLSAAAAMHEKHGDFNWDEQGGCRLVCDVCGIGKWNHDYWVTDSQGYDNSDDARASFTEYTCRKCGEIARLDYQGGKRVEGYFLIE